MPRKHCSGHSGDENIKLLQESVITENERNSIRYCSTNQNSGFYVLHMEMDGKNIPAGHIFNNRTRQSTNWSVRSYTPLTPAQAQELRDSAALKREERSAQHTEAEERVAEGLPERIAKWQPMTSIEPGSYFDRKQLPPDSGVYKTHNAVVVPGHDVNGKLWTACIILEEDGTKLYLQNSRKEGMFHALGGMDQLLKADAIIINEGYSTAATVKKALDMPNVAHVAAFDKGNLMSVGLALSQKCPGVPIFFGADMDLHLKENDGLEYALDAAEAIRARVVIPEFLPHEDPEKNHLTDFNDMAVKSELGLDGVRSIIAPAVIRELEIHGRDKARQLDSTHSKTVSRESGMKM